MQVGLQKKTCVDDKVHIYMAQWVSKGFKIDWEVSYDETFSPIIVLKSVEILLATITYHGYKISKMDVKTAFLK